MGGHANARLLRPVGGPMTSPEIEAGYRSLLRFSAEDMIAIHAEVASIGQTWDPGVRDRGTIDFIVEKVQSEARTRLAPAAIAAKAMVLVVREHPFWDANHRTGFQVADSILRAFGASYHREPARGREDRTGDRRPWFLKFSSPNMDCEAHPEAPLVERLEDIPVLPNGLLEFLLEDRLRLPSGFSDLLLSHRHVRVPMA